MISRRLQPESWPQALQTPRSRSSRAFVKAPGALKAESQSPVQHLAEQISLPDLQDGAVSSVLSSLRARTSLRPAPATPRGRAGEGRRDGVRRLHGRCQAPRHSGGREAFPCPPAAHSRPLPAPGATLRAGPAPLPCGRRYRPKGAFPLHFPSPRHRGTPSPPALGRRRKVCARQGMRLAFPRLLAHNSLPPRPCPRLFAGHAPAPLFSRKEGSHAQRHPPGLRRPRHLWPRTHLPHRRHPHPFQHGRPARAPAGSRARHADRRHGRIAPCGLTARMGPVLDHWELPGGKAECVY